MTNTNEAPEGYVAVPNPVNSYGCEFCAFSKPPSIMCNIPKLGDCSAAFRKDSTNVHFKQIKDS